MCHVGICLYTETLSFITLHYDQMSNFGVARIAIFYQTIPPTFAPELIIFLGLQASKHTTTSVRRTNKGTDETKQAVNFVLLLLFSLM